MHNILGYYVYNCTRNAWLQEDQESWGPFLSAQEFQEQENAAAAAAALEANGDDVIFVMEAS